MKAFQQSAHVRCSTAFGPAAADSVSQRWSRFLEEALELSQALGADAARCHELVDYVFSREVGEVAQELGGVMMTTALVAEAVNLDAAEEGWTELNRAWTKIDTIRGKEAEKVKAGL